MSRSQLGVSALLIWHVTAVGLGAIPSPSVDPLPPLALPRHVDDDVIAARVAPVLDKIAEIVAPVPMAVWRATRPVRPVVDFYVGMLHLPQRWSMFASPPTSDQYLKLRYYVGPKRSVGEPLDATWMATELVLPAHREDQVRTFQSFRDSSRDKALAIALDDFHRALERELDRSGRVPRALPDQLAPIGRLFSRTFQRHHLAEDERIIRTEVWYGEVPNPKRGTSLDTAVLAARLKVLQTYHQGPIRQPVSGWTSLAYGAIEREADITWMLKYVEPR